jgi:hypothetical protein
MDHSSRGLMPPTGCRLLAFIDFQHPDQPHCAAIRPQTHPLKTRIASLLHALRFMRD